MFKLFTKTPETEPMEYEDTVYVGLPERVAEIPPLWAELFERMDAIEAKIDLLLDNQTF